MDIVAANTLRTLMRDYYYGMDKIISSHSQYDECDRHKRFVAEEQTYTPIITTYPLERLQMDVTYPKLRTNGHQDMWLATARDHFTGYCWVKVIDNRSSETMTNFYNGVINNIFMMTTVPIVLTIAQYDQCSEGRGQYEQAVANSGTRLIRGVAHPQSNGGIEQFHGKIKPLATIVLHRNGGTYESAIVEAMRIYNHRPSSVAPITPFQMIYNPKYWTTRGATMNESVRATASLLHSLVVNCKAKRRKLDGLLEKKKDGE